MVTKEISPVVNQSTSLKMSFSQFLEWGDEDTHAEWIDGEVIVFMPAKKTHQNIIGFLYELIGLFVRLYDLGQVQFAPFIMKLPNSVREPDLFFVTKENLHRLTEDRLEGTADLVVEVISKDSVARDRRDKYKEYQDAGIHEYWVIDPRPGKLRADFFRLDDDGDYTLFATEDDEKIYSKVLPNFWLRPAWLWQAETINPLTCALQIEGVAAKLQAQIDASNPTNHQTT